MHSIGALNAMHLTMKSPIFWTAMDNVLVLSYPSQKSQAFTTSVQWSIIWNIGRCFFCRGGSAAYQEEVFSFSLPCISSPWSTVQDHQYHPSIQYPTLQWILLWESIIACHQSPFKCSRLGSSSRHGWLGCFYLWYLSLWPIWSKGGRLRCSLAPWSKAAGNHWATWLLLVPFCIDHTFKCAFGRWTLSSIFGIFHISLTCQLLGHGQDLNGGGVRGSEKCMVC